MSRLKPISAPRVTVEDYLRSERAAGERHEYLDGTVIAMAGESDAHGRVTFNLTGLVYSQLKGKPCQGRVKDTKIRSGRLGPWNPRATAGLFSYPDIVVICGDPQFLDEHNDVVTNPTAIIEVLSPSTEAFDRGEKFARYRQWNPTLTDYLLVSQDRPRIEHFSRLADGSWRFTSADGLASAVEIPAIGCVLGLADVYDRVPFPGDESADGG